MSKIQWDNLGEKRFEAGVDRGVFYHSSVDGGVPWNGLISIDDASTGGTLTQHYIDGSLYYNEVSPTDFKAVLEAFTYPKQVDSVNGSAYSGGLSYENQNIYKTFGLSYRTMLGNDTQLTLFGYKIHMIYNCIALPRTGAATTISNPADPINFKWDIVATPSLTDDYYGKRPTSHIVWDTTRTRQYKTDEIEKILYGTTSVSPRLPSLEELEAINTWEQHIRIVPNNTTGIHRTSYLGSADLTGHPDSGLYSLASGTKLSQTTNPGIYKLGA